MTCACGLTSCAAMDAAVYSAPPMARVGCDATCSCTDVSGTTFTCIDGTCGALIVPRQCVIGIALHADLRCFAARPDHVPDPAPGTPSFAVRAELGRYPLVLTAAKLVGGYWNRLARLDDERLAKQAFLRNLELGALAAGQREATAPWVGQVHSFLTAAHVACDMVHPCEVDVKAVIA